MPPLRRLLDGTPGEVPSHEDVQQLVEAEQGMGSQGIWRSWLAADSNKVVLVSDEAGVRISEDNGTTAPSQVLVASMLDDIIPPGTIWPYAGPIIPAGWLLCNGIPVSRTTYAKLFAAIGDYWGAGLPGGTTFNLPDLVGRVLLGVSATHPLAERSGSELGPAHTHGLGGHQHGSADHAHSILGHGHDINHNHATKLSELAATGTLAMPNGGVGSLSFQLDTHRHQVDLDPLGSFGSSGPTGMDTTHAETPGLTGGPTVANTAAPAFGSTVNLPPFGAVQWMIRAGA